MILMLQAMMNSRMTMQLRLTCDSVFFALRNSRTSFSRVPLLMSMWSSSPQLTVSQVPRTNKCTYVVVYAKGKTGSFLTGIICFSPASSRCPAMVSMPAWEQVIAVAAVIITAGRKEAKATAGRTFLPLM